MLVFFCLSFKVTCLCKLSHSITIISILMYLITRDDLQLEKHSFVYCAFNFMWCVCACVCMCVVCVCVCVHVCVCVCVCVHVAGWKGSGSGLGVQQQGIQEPIKGGEVRDKHDKFKVELRHNSTYVHVHVVQHVHRVQNNSCIFHTFL